MCTDGGKRKRRRRKRRRRRRRRKVATLYLLENEGFHSGKDEGNITKAAQRRSSNPAGRSAALYRS